MRFATLSRGNCSNKYRSSMGTLSFSFERAAITWEKHYDMPAANAEEVVSTLDLSYENWFLDLMEQIH